MYATSDFALRGAIDTRKCLMGQRRMEIRYCPIPFASCPMLHINRLLLLPNPFRGMGAWRRTMEPQKPGNSPGPGPEVVKTQRVAKERATQRVRCWTVQNKMRDVLGPVSAGAAERILDSANSKEVRA